VAFIGSSDTKYMITTKKMRI